MKEGDADHAGCDGKKSKNYSEIEVPEGMDIEEYKEGFETAVKAYAEALELGQDIEYEETEDSTPSFEAGIKAGFEFAQADFQEPTFEAAKKKRGTDNLNSSDVGVKETPKSKIFEASEEVEEEFEEKKKKKTPSADELRAEQVKDICRAPAVRPKALTTVTKTRTARRKVLMTAMAVTTKVLMVVLKTRIAKLLAKPARKARLVVTKR